VVGFATFETRTIIKGRLKLLSALHIGRGQSLEPVGTDQPVVKDLLGQPFIPGSSFKGVLRSNAERIAATLYQGNTGIIPPCFITDNKDGQDGGCISYTRDVGNMEPGDIWKKLCPVCRLFGSPHFASKMAIKDLTVVHDTWFDHFERRDGVAIDRGTETASPRKLYDLEVVPAGVEFDLNIVVENANDKDLGLLYLALRDFERGAAFIGGSKTKGLGNVKLTYGEIEEIDNSSLVNYLLGGRGIVYGRRDVGGEGEESEEAQDEPEEPDQEFPEFEPPEAVDTMEHLYTMLCIALSELNESERKAESAIRAKLHQMGVTKKKLQELGFKSRKLTNLLSTAVADGWLMKLEDGQYIAIGRPAAKAEGDFAREEVKEETPSEEGPVLDIHDLEEYVETKINRFVSYITRPPEGRETEDAQEESV
jgi:CRISPR-associated protein Csm3